MLDPHGDLVESLMKSIPEDRINDVIYINPALDNYSVYLNPFSFDMDNRKKNSSYNLDPIRDMIVEPFYALFKDS